MIDRKVLLGPIKDGLLEPNRVERMAAELAREFEHAMQARAARAEEAPAELQALDARIELASAHPEARSGARVLVALPRAAEAYRRQIEQGLNGDARAALKARVILRELFGGQIRMVPDAGGGLTAHWNFTPEQFCVIPWTRGSGGVH
jgi:hypothetical protein